MQQVFSLLKKYWHHLNLKTDATVLVPLCGKSLDLDWLAGQGHHVVGVEISEIALKEVMERQPYSFHRSAKGSFTRYHSSSMELWCGDIFKLRQRWLPPVNAVYDKSALIALPPETRSRYAHKIQSLLQPQGKIFINTFEYPQDEMGGPPFAVFEDELVRLYSDRFEITRLHSHSIFEDLSNFQRRGLKSYLNEKIYTLTPEL